MCVTGLPATSRAMFSAMVSAAVLGCVMAEMCGATVMRGLRQKRCPGGRGSVSNTSSVAPAKRPDSSAAISFHRMPAAGDVDQPGARRQLSQGPTVQDATCLRRQRQQAHQELRRRQEWLEALRPGKHLGARDDLSCARPTANRKAQPRQRLSAGQPEFPRPMIPNCRSAANGASRGRQSARRCWARYSGMRRW